MVDLSQYRDPRFAMPAIRVKSDHPEHEQGFIVINEEDFDPKIHELWEEPVPKSEAKPAESSKQEHVKPAARADRLHLK